jgi:hypothetical protein
MYIQLMKEFHDVFAFISIKQALFEAPVLVSPNFGKDFIIFSFASEHTIVGVLLQKNEQNKEQPIAFYSKALRDSTLKYDIMEKHAYACVKALKEFRVYILHSHSTVFVPSATIKDILTQAEPDGRRAKWIATLLEYGIDIKPTKLVKGQGLAKFMAHSNHEALGINSFESCTNTSAQQEEGKVHPDFLASPWYKDIVHVLLNLQAPPELSKTQARSVKLKATKFCILNKFLYWKDLGSILLNCLLEEEAKKKTKEFHSGDCGGHLY